MKIGITGPTLAWSKTKNDWCVIFYCAMIARVVFDDIGLLSEEFGAGNGEDVEFCTRAQDRGWNIVEAGNPVQYTPNRITGEFPLRHIGGMTLDNLEKYDRNNRACIRMVGSSA